MRTKRTAVLAAVLVASVALASTPVADSGTPSFSADSGSADLASATVQATAVAAGAVHSCALTSAGGVKCWGFNGHDELGDGGGTSRNSSTPVDVSGLRAGVAAIAAGIRHSCAVTGAGGVKCWGTPYSGALGDGTDSRRFAPVDVSGLGGGVTAVAAGSEHSCALTSAGGMKCWGNNRSGAVGDGTTTDRWTPVDVSGLSSGVTAIAAGGVRSCALTSAGGIKCWGGYPDPAGVRSTPVDVSGVSGGVTAITVGCALTSGGRVQCWGSDLAAVDVPGLSSGVTAIAGGLLHGCALTSAGGVKCWGSNDRGQLGDGTTVDRSTPVDVVGLSSGVASISVGVLHTCAVTRTAAVKCWGWNPSGQLGDGTTVDRSTPVDVIGFGTAKTTVAVVSRSVTVTPARVAAVNLRCGSQAPCRGTLSLSANASAGRGHLKLGSHSFSIAAGRTRTVEVKLTARGFALLVGVKRLPTQAQVSYDQPAGGTTTATRTITLRAP